MTDLKTLQLQLLIAAVNKRYKSHDCPFELLMAGINVISQTPDDSYQMRYDKLKELDFPEIVNATVDLGVDVKVAGVGFLEDIFEAMTDFNFPTPPPAPVSSHEKLPVSESDLLDAISVGEFGLLAVTIRKRIREVFRARLNQ